MFNMQFNIFGQNNDNGGLYWVKVKLQGEDRGEMVSFVQYIREISRVFCIAKIV